MNVYDFHDAKADLKDFAFNCRRLLQLETILKQKRKEIDQLTLRSGKNGFIAADRDKSRTYRADDHDALFDLMEETDRLELEYTALRTRIRLISKALASMHLDEKKIKLLQLSFEANQTIRTTARILKSDPVTTWELLKLKFQNSTSHSNNVSWSI